MDPVTIVTSIAKITSTCVSTGKTIYDLSCKYQDAPRNMIAISAEVAVVSASLSQIQVLVLSRSDHETLLQTRPEIAATLDTSLTGCMVLFSCLEEELSRISRHAWGLGSITWKGKLRTVWKQETIQELLDGIRGQQLAINTLIQLLQMDSLSEITQLLKQKAPELKKTVERTGSLRRLYPSVKVAESIYSNEDRMSIYSATDSIMASSDLEFEFDDAVVNSGAYRRALAAARHKASTQRPVAIDGDLIDFSDHETVHQAPVSSTASDTLALPKDLLGLRFSASIKESSTSSDMISETQRGEQITDVTKVPVAILPEMQSKVPYPHVKRKPITASHDRTGSVPARQEESVSANGPGLSESKSGGLKLSPGTSMSPTASSSSYDSRRPASRICFKCGKDIRGQFVRALGNMYHPDCFICMDCGKVVHSKFFVVSDEPPHQYALCERDFFKRLGLLCSACGNALRGSYVTALDKLYHAEHFTCSICQIVFGSDDHYFEGENEPYCFFHYASLFARLCNGCTLPVMEKFVQLYLNGKNEVWHPECYMVQKCWDIRIHSVSPIAKVGSSWTDNEGRELDVVTLKRHCDSTMHRASRTRLVLGRFERTAEVLISNILRVLISGQQADFARNMSQFVSMVGALFTALEFARKRNIANGVLRKSPDLKSSLVLNIYPDSFYPRRAKLLCEMCLNMINIAAGAHSSKDKTLRETQSLISLTTRSTQCVKALICLGAEDSINSLDSFLGDMSEVYLNEGLKEYKIHLSEMADSEYNRCMVCNEHVGDKCFRRDGLVMQFWHDECLPCLNCSRLGGFTGGYLAVCDFCEHHCEEDIHYITPLKHSVQSLWEALARLMKVLNLDRYSLVELRVEARHPDDLMLEESSLPS